MPVGQFDIPPPTHWEDFETLCLDLWRILWEDPEAQRNGRSGQAQAGVDIFGRPKRAGFFAGVQCRCKSGALEPKLSEKELVDAVGMAATFSPELSEFTLATTARRDQHIQEVARRLTLSSSKVVSVASWDDISEWLLTHRSVLTAHYPQLLSPGEFVRTLPNGMLEFDLYRSSSTVASVQQAFVTDAVRAALHEDLQSALREVITELADNAFAHGGATWFGVTIGRDIVALRDNGEGFNPLTAVPSPGRHGGAGLLLLSLFRRDYTHVVRFAYNRESSVNAVTMLFVSPLSSDAMSQSCVLHFDHVDKVERVLEREKDRLVRRCREVYLNYDPPRSNPSGAAWIASKVLEELPPEVRIVLSFPPGSERAREVCAARFRGEPRVEIR